MKFSAFLTVLSLTGLGFSGTALAEYGPNYVGDQIEYRAKYEDTFVFLARDYNLGYVEMRAANPGVDPWIPGAGTKLILPARHILPDAPREGIVVNLPEMRLYHYVNGDGPPDTYPLGVGREGLDTPLGSTKVMRKTEGPYWYPNERMRREKPELKAVVPPGPDNPMGTHAMYLGWPQYTIHGTDRPFGIGRRISSGCIRLYPEGVIDLYNKTPVGTKVTVVDQPIKVAWIGDELFIEAHAGIEQSIEMEETGQVVAPKLSEADMARIIKVAGPYKDRLRWAAVRTAVKERRGYPVAIARRPGVEVDADTVSMNEPANKAEQKKQEAAEKAALKQEAKAALQEIYSVPEAQGPSSAGAKAVRVSHDAEDSYRFNQ
jgi:L,D-transpeptidase ErfK/SrfK